MGACLETSPSHGKYGNFWLLVFFAADDFGERNESSAIRLIPQPGTDRWGPPKRSNEFPKGPRGCWAIKLNLSTQRKFSRRLWRAQGFIESSSGTKLLDMRQARSWAAAANDYRKFMRAFVTQQWFSLPVEVLQTALMRARNRWSSPRGYRRKIDQDEPGRRCDEIVMGN